MKFASREDGREGSEAPNPLALRRQEALIDLQRRLLRSRGKNRMLAEAVRCVAQELSVPLAEVLKLSPDGERFEYAEGVGFEGLEGSWVGIGLSSQAGYTLISKQPVVAEDLGTERRFEACELLRKAGAVSGITVKVHRGGTPYGVLGAHDYEPRVFAPEELGFLQDVAEALGLGIASACEAEDRRRQIEAERSLRREHTNFRELVSRACAALAGCRTAEGALETAAKLASGSPLGDWCFVDVLEEPEGPDDEPMVVRAAVAGPVEDPRHRRIAEELGWHRSRLDASATHGAHRVLATGQPDVIERVSEADLAVLAPSREALGCMRAIAPRSYIGVPMRAGGRLVGVLGIVAVDEELPAADRRLAPALAPAPGAGRLGERRRKEDLETMTTTTTTVGERAGATGVENRPGEERPVGTTITPRQLDVLRLMEAGMPDAAIARRLHLSVKTVNSHAHRLYRILGASSRTQAVSVARKAGVL